MLRGNGHKSAQLLQKWLRKRVFSFEGNFCTIENTFYSNGHTLSRNCQPEIEFLLWAHNMELGYLNATSPTARKMAHRSTLGVILRTYLRPHNLFRQSHLCFDKMAKTIIILGYHHLLWCEKLVFNTWNGPVILLVLKHRLFLDAILARSFVVVVILSFYINHYQGQTFRILGLYETFVSLSCIMMAKVIYKEKTRKHISVSIKRPRLHISSIIWPTNIEKLSALLDRLAKFGIWQEFPSLWHKLFCFQNNTWLSPKCEQSSR